MIHISQAWYVQVPTKIGTEMKIHPSPKARRIKKQTLIYTRKVLIYPKWTLIQNTASPDVFDPMSPAHELACLAISIPHSYASCCCCWKQASCQRFPGSGGQALDKAEKMVIEGEKNNRGKKGVKKKMWRGNVFIIMPLPFGWGSICRSGSLAPFSDPVIWLQVSCAPLARPVLRLALSENGILLSKKYGPPSVSSCFQRGYHASSSWIRSLAPLWMLSHKDHLVPWTKHCCWSPSS